MKIERLEEQISVDPNHLVRLTEMGNIVLKYCRNKSRGRKLPQLGYICSAMPTEWRFS